MPRSETVQRRVFARHLPREGLDESRQPAAVRAPQTIAWIASAQVSRAPQESATLAGDSALLEHLQAGVAAVFSSSSKPGRVIKGGERA
jgi:hypothetical protein